MAAAASRKEEERNERVVRGLLKLPPNRRCINCNGIGPQYVCTSFWTFNKLREFTHRVKSVSMSKFTVEEVEALQKGGNQRAKEALLKEFDTQQRRLPDSSNTGSLREFIRDVYVERRYAAVKNVGRPPRDKQNPKAQEEECTRASSYHSFSESPPYDYQYEERRTGKQLAMLSRKPGSDRGHDENMSAFSYRSHSLHEKMFDDQFANESCGSRTSDCSGSSMSDTFRTTLESPNFLDNECLSPPIQQSQSNVHISNGTTQSQRTASTGNINSNYLKSGNSSLADLFFDSENVKGTDQANNFVAPSFADFSGTINGANESLFCQPVLQQPVTGLKPSVDFFTNMSCTTPAADKVPLAAQSTENGGWATFDTPPENKERELTVLSGVTRIGNDKQIPSHNLFSFELDDKPTFFQTSKDNASMTNQSVTLSLETSYQFWHSFDDASGTMSNDPSSAQPVTNEQIHVVNGSPTTSNSFTWLEASKESHEDKGEGKPGALAPACAGSGEGSDKLFSCATFSAFTEPSSTSSVHLLRGTAHDQVQLNPFDFPFDDDSEAQDLFMDMSALQAALPSSDLPTSFLDGLPETWFINSTGSHGGSACLVQTLPSCPLRNITLRTVSSGNPFE